MFLACPACGRDSAPLVKAGGGREPQTGLPVLVGVEFLQYRSGERDGHDTC